MTNTSSRQFQTAAARRGGVPLKFTVEHLLTPPMPEDWDRDKEGEWEPETETILREMMLDPLVDVVRIGAAFGGFGQMLQSFSTDTEMSAEEKMHRLDVELPRARAAMRELLISTDRKKWDEVKEGVDVTTLGEIVRWVTMEMSGLDPTQQRSSSDGSTSTGDSSTGGPPPAV